VILAVLRRILRTHAKLFHFNVFTLRRYLALIAFTAGNLGLRFELARSEAADSKDVYLRKRHRAAGRSTVPELGVACPQFIRCAAARFLNLAVSKHLLIPQAAHLWMFPSTPEQIAKGQPRGAFKVERNPVVVGPECNIDLAGS
jgi:hypothetical protein